MVKEKDRFEELINGIGYVMITDLKFDKYDNITDIQTIKLDLNKFRNNLREMLQIYTKLKEDNEKLKVANTLLKKFIELIAKGG